MGMTMAGPKDDGLPKARQAGWTDLDHVVPDAVGGPTDCANLSNC
jgi:hypothetical protein